MSEYLAARLAKANLANKVIVARFVEQSDFNDNLRNLIKKLFQIKQNMYIVEKHCWQWMKNTKDIWLNSFYQS